MISGHESEPEAPVRLIVGLGNPGPEYAGTRHNAGFGALDLFASRLGVSPRPFEAGGQVVADLHASPAHGAGRRFALLWPLTYMNRCGGAVVAALRRFATVPSEIFVITDDFHLPLGAMRARASGSPGGHNGLKSVEASLGTQGYPRLRLGVGEAAAGMAVEFVLTRFRRSEEKIVEEMLESASWAAEDWARGLPIEEIQARYNRRSP